LGAEWALEFLNSCVTNPSYELQLPYGAYTAARMNAELGTTYDVAKLVNWCFDVGPLRSWGAIVGQWGGYDCSGLIGEVNGTNDYAFAMNTFEQIGALVPMVRYDDRFARAIGKWVLNAANAARLFYTNYLPDDHQDSEEWSHQYDLDSYIAHEALRQYNGGISPYATGDAIRFGWGRTNLALYASSHVGILGGIIDTTNVPMILKLDVLKTDYFRANAYPTFLYFNPDDSDKTVAINVGSGQHDLYDAVTNSFLGTGVTGTTSFAILANSAVLLVVVPAGGTVTYNLEKMMINGVVVDYHSGRLVSNYPPRIKSLASNRLTVLPRDTVTVYCTATDRDNDSLTYTWRPSKGIISGDGPTITWVAPDSQGTYIITCMINDSRGGQDSAKINLQVVLSINHPPVVSKLSARPRKIDLGATSQLTCTATDPDGDPLSYTWTSAQGSISGNGSTVTWAAPGVEGNYFVVCTVDDGRGGTVTDSIGIVVRDFSRNQTGDLVAYYPFNGNAVDASGNSHNGTVYGATLTNERLGNPNSAYYFDGTTSYIQVPNSSSLNFQQSISINYWMNLGAFYNREQYPISHGNWENRWKVSISNQRLRWTVKTTTGIKDLDSETPLQTNMWDNVTVLYSGSDFEVYLNGELDAFSSWSGTILPTTFDLTIGQVLPNNQNYNFRGVLDEIRIFNYALSVKEIQDLAGVTTSVNDSKELLPTEYFLDQNYPNPFNPRTNLRYGLPTSSYVSLKVFDMLGREIATLAEGNQEPGIRQVIWNAEGLSSGVYFLRLSTQTSTLTRKVLLLR
ncbi:MAG: LamG-like jellyroll fold domain-containing protein, partial [Bacteroidota bacterium]